MKRLIPILLLMFFSTPVMAVEPITGAFGIKLGDVWNEKAHYTYERDGYLRAPVIPESPLDAFTHYYIEVTPVKGLIFRIEAWKGGNGTNQWTVLERVLSKKYGKPAARRIDPLVWEASWRQANRIIKLRYSWNFNKKLEIIDQGLILQYADYAIYRSRLDELVEEVEPDSL